MSGTSSETTPVEIIQTVARNRWTHKQKLRMVEESMQPGNSVSRIARQHGFLQLCHKWRRLMLKGGAVAVEADDQVVSMAEVKILQKRIRELERNGIKPKRRRTRVLLGRDGIRYGDKFICVCNHKRRNSYHPRGDGEPLNYVANGEIGIVEFVDENENCHKVRFTSQPDTQYKWTSGISEDCPLELAYALTAQNTQGSEFVNMILIINELESGWHPLLSPARCCTQP